MITREEYNKALDIIREYHKQIEVEIKNNDQTQKLRHLDLSPRTYNVLTWANIETISDLLPYTLDELYKIRGLGRKGVIELQDLVEGMGYKLPRR
jgi:DNA-directed RNA polymerase alpha subunit